MIPFCIRCYTKDRVKIISCGHYYCLECVNLCYNENKRICIKNCKIKIKGKVDILPFFHTDKRRELLLYDNFLDYFQRIEVLDKYFIDHKRELYNTFIYGDKRYKHIRKDDLKFNFKNFMKIKNDIYFVYEIYEHKISNDEIISYDCLSVTTFIIYYQYSKIGFIYKRNFNYQYGSMNCFYLREIIESIEKETLEQVYLRKRKERQHLHLLQQNPDRESSLLNPKGYVQFPLHFEKLFRNYVNQTCTWDEKRKLHCFQNYRWIHFQDMLYLEKKYRENIKKIYFQILMKKEILYNDIVHYIISFLMS